jgi:hypothetical protein
MEKSEHHMKNDKRSAGNMNSIGKDSKRLHRGHRVVRYEEQSQGPITVVRRKRAFVDITSSPTQSNLPLSFSRFVEGELPTLTPIRTNPGEFVAGISSEDKINKTNCDTDQTSKFSLSKLKVNKSLEVESNNNKKYSRNLSQKLQKMSVNNKSTSFESRRLAGSDNSKSTVASSNETLVWSNPEGDVESCRIFNKMHGDSKESIDFILSCEGTLPSSQGTKKEPDPDDIGDDEYLEIRFDEEGLAAGGSAKVEGNESTYTVDDEAFLWAFPPVIRSASITLEGQVIPLDQSFTLKISDVYSPVRFWFHCESNVTEMMEEMQLDYGKLRPTDLKIHEGNIKPGMLVACFYHETGQWHRAQIILKPSDNKKDKHCARVFFVDFGTVKDTETSDLKVSCWLNLLQGLL